MTALTIDTCRCGAAICSYPRCLYLPRPRHGSLPPVPVAETHPDDPWLASATGPLTVDVCDCDAGCECDDEAEA